MANKNVSSSIRPRAKPRRASPPRTRTQNAHEQFMRGLNRTQAEEPESSPRRYAKGGAVCRGMGAAKKGGGYKK